MRIVTKQRIRVWGAAYPDAAASLQAWYEVARKAHWQSLAEVRHDLPSADGVELKSGRTVTVFNVRGGKYRMITGIHYNRQRIFLLRFLTHAEYDTDKWKSEL